MHDSPKAVDKENRGVHANAVSFSASVEKNFRGAQTQIHAHSHDIAALKVQMKGLNVKMQNRQPKSQSLGP